MLVYFRYNDPVFDQMKGFFGDLGSNFKDIWENLKYFSFLCIFKYFKEIYIFLRIFSKMVKNDYFLFFKKHSKHIIFLFIFFL